MRGEGSFGVQLWTSLYYREGSQTKIVWSCVVGEGVSEFSIYFADVINE